MNATETKEWDERMDRALAQCGGTGILILRDGKTGRYRAFVEGLVIAKGVTGTEVMTGAVAALLEREG